jgi:hypothetical protein
MANLRLIQVKAGDIRTINASFNNTLDPLIGTSNVTVSSLIVGTPDAEIIAVSVSGNKLAITVQPLTPHAAYLVTFKSTQTVIFKSLDGASVLFEDGSTNTAQILGPEDPENPIRNNLVSFLKDNVYNLSRGTLVRLIIDQLATSYLGARTDIRQSKTDNYLKFQVFDERKVRGSGPFDRLNEEGVFNVVRVGKTPTGDTGKLSFSFDSFPFDLITLQRTDVIGESLQAGNSDVKGTFDGLTLTVNNGPVTKVNSVVIKYQNSTVFTYDIRSYGYRLQNPVYDTAYASTLLSLEDNQVKLSDEILDAAGFVVPGGGDIISINYEYKFVGRFVDESTVQVSQVLNEAREPTPALLNQFSLGHAPIVTAADQIPTSGGVQFLDPNSATPFLTIHPAFTTEIPFVKNAIPSSIGEYAVDYETGTVLVYGATSAHDGSGNFPPGATYNYRNVFVSGLDYTYRAETSELVASPIRDLISQSAKISFSFEDVLVAGKDYNALVHKEVIDERIQNRIKTTNSIGTLNASLTDVFRIFNETTGEVYSLTRFNDSSVFFNFRNAPRILQSIRERATFESVTNESLIVSKDSVNILSTRVLKAQLLNNRIMSTTDDVIGSSYNTSAQFSKTSIFVTELYYDTLLSPTINTNRLNVGQYQIDYRNGTVYVGVTNAQTFDIGTVSYKKPAVVSQNAHILGVSNIYYSLDPNTGVTKTLNYTSFNDTEIFPSSFDVSDERFLNGDTTLPYFENAGTITVTDDIKNIRHIFDVYDLDHNIVPTDFSDGATFSANIITLDPSGVEKREVLVVEPGLKLNVSFISPGIEVKGAISAVRIIDGYQLLDGYETISGNTITLSVTSGAVVGNVVDVIYTVVMNGAATPIVDYNRGDYFIDYTYLADEILVSYEYGDNVLDFREGSALGEGDEYFVTYQAGALRDALQNNFGSLVDIPELNAVDIHLSRDTYRDALTAALQCFTKGPTIPAISAIASNITKINPQIIESVFDVWSLGISYLFKDEIVTYGNPKLVAGKFDQGILIDTPGQAVSFSVSNNVRLDEGTIETWIIPEWNGLDNDATLTISPILKGGYAISASAIFIGASSFNPTLDDSGSFSLNRRDDLSPVGLPSAIYTKLGMFIFYDTDVNHWKIISKDFADGYVYSGTVQSSGEVYDAKFIDNFSHPGDIIRSSGNKIDFSFNMDGYQDGYIDGYTPGYAFDGITFMADEEHFIFDFAETKDKNRFSLFKDGSGYLNFSVWDRGGKYNQKKDRRNNYNISADIQGWLAGEKHHVAISWKLNTSDRRDEMHLFVDGFEVPNIMLYGGRPISTSTDRFGTVKPEIIAGTVPLTCVVGADLQTNSGSYFVTSASNNFTSDGILPGNTIQINETGFSTYSILAVSGNTLQLNTAMPATLSDAKFSVNPYSAVVSSEIDLYSNIAVSILSGAVETEIPGLRATVPAYSISKNGLNQNVLTLLGDAKAGDKVLIRTLGRNHRRCRDQVFIWGNTQAVLKTALPPPINLDEASIVAVVMPYTVIGPANSTISFGNFVATGLPITQPTNSTEGRKLSIRVTGGNVNFGTPTTVTINGTTAAGPLLETLTFSAAGTQSTTNKFKTTSSVDVQTTPLITSKNGVAVEIKEVYPITIPDGNNAYPVIRFAYKTQSGFSLQGTGNTTVTDNNGFFPLSDVGNLLVITYPAPVAGTYTIANRLNNTNVQLNIPTGSAFSGGKYDTFNVSIGRSGFQNGFFFLETAGMTNIPYPIPQGVYEFDYQSFLEVPFDPINQTAFVGSDFNLTKPAKAVLDELRISSHMMTDTRVGETIAANQESITTDFISIRELRKNHSTLALLHFNSLPLINDSDFYVLADRDFVQSADSVNANFGQSIVITDKGLSFDNNGRLTTRSEGTIEFWVSPRFDTYNDPVPRVYFDATSSVVEEEVSITKGTVKVSRSIEQVLSVRLQTDTKDSGQDYFQSGTVSSDRQTINLKVALPYQQTPVKIAYIPSGLGGDRITILKDQSGFIAFNVRAQGKDVQIRQPIFWARDSWHRIRATYKFNRADNKDEIRLFCDGEERGVVLFGSGLLFGQGFIFGQTTVGVTNQILVTDINFKDPINQFFIGSDYLGVHAAEARIDNFRLSDIARIPVTIAGQPIDTTYSSNFNVVFPVIEDAFTTFLLDFNSLLTKNTDFAILRDDVFGIFDFTMNIIDSFNIVSSSSRVQKILESLILALKPATAIAEIHIIK